MPIPEKKSGEKVGHYVSRFMKTCGDKYKSKKQALAVGYSEAGEAKKSAYGDARDSKLWQQYVNLYRGYHGSTLGLEGAYKMTDKELERAIYGFQTLTKSAIVSAARGVRKAVNGVGSVRKALGAFVAKASEKEIAKFIDKEENKVGLLTYQFYKELK